MRADTCLGPAARVALMCLRNCPDRSTGTRDLVGPSHRHQLSRCSGILTSGFWSSHLTNKIIRLQHGNVSSREQTSCKYRTPVFLSSLCLQSPSENTGYQPKSPFLK